MLNKMTIQQVIAAARKMRESFPDCGVQLLVRSNGDNSQCVIVVPVKEWKTEDGQPSATVMWEHGQVVAQTWHAKRFNERQQLRRVAECCREAIKGAIADA